MNVNRYPDARLRPEMFQRNDMRLALARRDTATVFRILQKHGISQRKIAGLTGQSQSEISEIMSGRQVMAYDVHVRIADGLGVPRGYLGLGYDPATEAILEAEGQPGDGQRADPHDLVAHAAKVTLGAASLDPQNWSQPFAKSRTPDPVRVGKSDVERLEVVTAELRAWDDRFGGGACHEAVVAHAQSAQRMLRADMPDDVALRLHVALADLHTVAGWASSDVGLFTAARLHFGRALEQARYAGESSLVAKVLYCTGRMALGAGQAVEALRLIQLGQVAAQESSHPLAVALIAANEALVYGILGDARQADNALRRARDRFSDFSTGRVVPPWLTVVDEAEMRSLTGTTYASLPQPSSEQQAAALESLDSSLALRSSRLVRSRTLDTVRLSDILFAWGDPDAAVGVSRQALALAETVRSSRVFERLGELRTNAVLHQDRPDVAELVGQIDAVRV